MSRRTVLVVDDDHGIADGVRLRLRSAGYETLVASDGMDGIAAAIEHQPDVVLMDVRMPNMDGLAALETLRIDGQTRHIPVIMLSASLRDQETALEAGAQFFLTKPYRSHDLLAAIECALDNDRQLRETAK
ncbi:MAG: response regulator [Pirellulaceae bacterium]